MTDPYMQVWAEELARRQRARQQAAYADRRSKGLCVKNGCGQPALPGQALCPAHKADNAAGSKARRERRKAAGQCVLCGEPAIEGQTMCAAHQARHNAANDASRARANSKQRQWKRARSTTHSREYRAQFTDKGICFECRERPLAPGRKRCRVCLDGHAKRKAERLAKKGDAGTPDGTLSEGGNTVGVCL